MYPLICTRGNECGVWKGMTSKGCVFMKDDAHYISRVRNTECPFEPETITVEKNKGESLEISSELAARYGFTPEELDVMKDIAIHCSMKWEKWEWNKSQILDYIEEHSLRHSLSPRFGILCGMSTAVLMQPSDSIDKLLLSLLKK